MSRYDYARHLLEEDDRFTLELAAAGTTIGDDITGELLQRYRDAAGGEKAFKETKDEAGNQLKLLLGDAEVALDRDGRTAFSWKSVTSKRLDMDGLKQAHPEIVAEFTKPSASRRLYVPKKGTP
jgi:predicted phage-related endonuclease